MGILVTLTPRTGATTGAPRKSLNRRVSHDRRVVNLPGRYVCPGCGLPAPVTPGRVRGRWLIHDVTCRRCDIEYQVREDLADADARTKGGWLA